MALPGFIAPPKTKKARATKAKAAPASAVQVQPMQASAPDDAATSQATNTTQTTPRTSQAQHVRKADTRSQKTNPARGGANGEARGKARGLQSARDDGAAPIGSPILAMSARPEVAAELERLRPGCTTRALEAMLDGAATKGASGAADRGQLWRMMAMPWVGEGANDRRAGTLLGAVLGEAVARLEGHRGRAPVTVDATADAKALTDNAD